MTGYATPDAALGAALLRLGHEIDPAHLRDEARSMGLKLPPIKCADIFRPGQVGAKPSFEIDAAVLPELDAVVRQIKEPSQTSKRRRGA